MKGRQEDDKRYEERALRLCSEYKILEKFYYSMFNKTAKTAEAYVRYCEGFLSFIKRIGGDPYTLSSITLADINRYINNTKYCENDRTKEAGESIRNAKIFAVKCFFKFLETNGYIQNNITENIETMPDNKQHEIIYLTKEEVEGLRTAIMKRNTRQYNDDWRKRDLLLISLGVRTGMRESAICQINVEDIDLDNCKITVVEKGNVEKDVYFGDETRKLIVDWLQVRPKYARCDALFVSQKHTRLTTSGLSKLIALYSKDIPKKVTPHKMRSTAAVNLYEATGDIYLVADQLGHKNIQNTRRYAMNTEKRRKSAASVLDRL